MAHTGNSPSQEKAGDEHSAPALRRTGQCGQGTYAIDNLQKSVTQTLFPVTQVLFFLDYIERLIYFLFDPHTLLDGQGRHYYPHFMLRKLT